MWLLHVYAIHVTHAIYDLHMCTCSPEILSDDILLKQFHGNVQGKAARDEKVNAHPVIKVTDLEYVSRSPRSPPRRPREYVCVTMICVYIYIYACVCVLTTDRTGSTMDTSSHVSRSVIDPRG